MDYKVAGQAVPLLLVDEPASSFLKKDIAPFLFLAVRL
jgi:hypothetical protein